MTFDNRCYHCQAALLERQTQCLACGSPYAREKDFWNAFNEGLKAQGMPAVDPYAADNERAMYAQLDAQRLAAKELAVQGTPQLLLETNAWVRAEKLRARLHRVR